MRATCFIAFLLTFAAASLIQAAPEPPKSANEAGPFEIDFSPLPGFTVNTQYKLHIMSQTRSGVTYKETFTIERFPVEDTTDGVKSSYESAGWKVRVVDGTRLVVEGLKDSPVVKTEVKIEGLPMKYTPTVKSLSKKGKEK